MRTIDADETYNVLTDYYHQRTEIQHKALKEAIERVPTVDAEPIKHGHWEHGEDVFGMYCQCSECGNQYYGSYEFKYCPNCGAKMDEEVNENETYRR